jgi:hypothetical protein
MIIMSKMFSSFYYNVMRSPRSEFHLILYLKPSRKLNLDVLLGPGSLCRRGFNAYST